MSGFTNNLNLLGISRPSYHCIQLGLLGLRILSCASNNNLTTIRKALFANMKHNRIGTVR